MAGELWSRTRLISSVRSKVALRRFWYSVRTTAEGKMAVMVALALPYYASILIRGGYRLPREAGPDGAAGALILAIIFTVIGVALGSASTAVRSLVLERGDEALRAFPAFRGPLAAHHLTAECVGSTIVFMVGAFLVMYAPTALIVPPAPWIGLPLTVAATVSISFLAGIRSYRAALRWIEVRPRSARMVHVVTGLVALLAFLFMPILPRVLLRHMPGLVEPIGSVLSLPGPWTVVPTLIIAGFSVMALRFARRAVEEVAQAPSPVIWNGVPTLGSGEYPSTFTALIRRPRRGARLSRLFLAKDVLLPWSRRPALLMTEFLLTFAFLGTGIAFAGLAHQRLPEHAAMLSTLSLLGSALVTISAMSLYRGAGCAGVEAPMLRILRPGVGFRRLWLYKLQAALLSVVPHAVLCVVALSLGIPTWGDLSQLPAALSMLAAAVLAFPALAVGVGFMFPRLDSPRGGLIPGSTLTGKTIGAGVMLYSSAAWAALLWMVAGGVVPPTLVPSTIVVFTGLVLGIAAVLSAFGIRRLRRLEL